MGNAKGLTLLQPELDVPYKESEIRNMVFQKENVVDLGALPHPSTELSAGVLDWLIFKMCLARGNERKDKITFFLEGRTDAFSQVIGVYKVIRRRSRQNKFSIRHSTLNVKNGGT